jgi:ABC-2 type transport system permease protein
VARQQLIPVIFMMLLWVAVITSSQHLMMSTIEEKSNRVMEVLLSAVSPLQLITGKILGHGGVGMLIVTVYASLGVGLLAVLGQLGLIDPMSLVYLGVYFFMAYFMIASIMAAVGSAVSDIREANTLVTPVMLVVMIPLVLWMPISQAPNGAFATSVSFIPPAIPFVMILRVTADEAVPLWQIPVTVVWGYACVLGMVWLAAKVFRVGVLMYGKPPSPLQLLKWVRYS